MPQKSKNISSVLIIMQKISHKYNFISKRWYHSNPSIKSWMHCMLNSNLISETTPNLLRRINPISIAFTCTHTHTHKTQAYIYKTAIFHASFESDFERRLVDCNTMARLHFKLIAGKYYVVT